jgi:two-component system response regulator HydG
MYFANHFLNEANQYLEKSLQGFDREVEQIFYEYNWPGNLREMKNIVKRATLLAKGKIITRDEIPPELYSRRTDDDEFVLYGRTNENEAIIKALEAADFNKSKAARLLRIDRKTLYNKLKLYDINLPEKGS